MSSAFKPEQGFAIKIGLCQLSVTPDKERNIKHARKAIEEAAQKGAQLVVLPEIWNNPYSNESFPVYAEEIDAGHDLSPSTTMLAEVSAQLRITIVGGSIPERCEDKLYNTCLFGTDGKLKAKHRKVTVAFRNKVDKLLNQGLDEEELSKKMDLFKESYSILSSEEERRLCD